MHAWGIKWGKCNHALVYRFGQCIAIYIRPNVRSNSFSNYSWTLVKRHQLLQCYIYVPSWGITLDMQERLDVSPGA